MTMEKYGVVLEPEKTKTAEEGETTVTDNDGRSYLCPNCGGPVLILPQGMGGQKVHCANCGTEPFEKRNDDKKQK